MSTTNNLPEPTLRVKTRPNDANKGGDIFGFIMEVEGMEFREALEYLARKAGVELANFDSKPSAEAAEQKKKLYEISNFII